MLIRNRVTISLIASTLANQRFNEHCIKLDEIVKESLMVAFKDEFISEKRTQRIVDKFCEELLNRG